uniref:Corticotropin-releasing factor domain-containing protein n=1 Tax=Salvator merianae TaxID=96440 RepID=A0A8D0C4R2_SALMN
DGQQPWLWLLAGKQVLVLMDPGGSHASVWVSPPRLPVLGAGAAALLVRPLQRLGPRGELLHRRPADLSGRLKRHTPPLSIDLTFLLLRQMMEISRAQSQQAQAKQNRLLLDSVGK